MSSFSLLPPEEFQYFFETSPNLMLILDTDFRITAVNAAYLKATHTKRENLLGLELSKVLLDNSESKIETGYQSLMKSLANVMITKKPEAMGLQKYNIFNPQLKDEKAKEKFWAPLNTPVLDQNGHVKYIIHRVEDFTDKVFLQSGKLELELFFSASLDMLCISSSDGYFKKMNPAVKQILGYTPEEMCERPYLDFIHPEDIERTKNQVAIQMEKHEPVFSFENRYRCKNGSYKLLSWKSTPIGELMYAAARDITDIRAAELELQTAKTSLEIANRDLESFSYSVAHDLRSPLRSMISFSKILVEEASQDLNAEMQEYLNRITSAAKQMNLLVEGLLSLAQISRSNLQKEKVNLSELAEDALEILKEEQPELKTQVHIQSGMYVDGDRYLLNSVVTNLLSNAWKYSSKNPEARIEFGSRIENGERIFYVQDNGAGFDMKFISKLFGVFQRLHTTHEFKGTGIGLATVQRVIRRHGGKIWAESAVGKGACFYFTLP